MQSALKTDAKHWSDDEVTEKKSGLLKRIEGTNQRWFITCWNFQTQLQRMSKWQITVTSVS